MPIVENGAPRHVSGVVEDELGLYFVGLKFLYSAPPAHVYGAGCNATREAETIADRTAPASP